jgi:hypothetical protein
MKLDPKIVEAAHLWYHADKQRSDTDEEIARRVILALAECVSDGAANAAREAYLSHEGSDDVEAMRAAIAAALRFEAGE